MRIKRTLRLKNAEVWKLDLPFFCFLVILDLRRPSEPGDYPYLPPEDVDGRDNYIKVFTISEVDLKESSLKLDAVFDLVEDLIYHVDQGFCDWNETRIVCKQEDITTTLNALLLRYTGIENLPEGNWKNLSQD
ncbi:hypothetical protein [Paenibacillus prosopidis]|uniref:Uncharacterized protein n=1 Tax=Paenibacillus prosopidis TaxID=630520 RepID=A0A368VHM3_9BACL|nr:hypothetical protein [Paenibacillus prosopidis]RCW40900.1 hypothetical protein DFP97_12822 [Paenibacillus prosopidis]